METYFIPYLSGGRLEYGARANIRREYRRFGYLPSLMKSERGAPIAIAIAIEVALVLATMAGMVLIRRAQVVQASRAQRKPRLPVELSGVLDVRAATR